MGMDKIRRVLITFATGVTLSVAAFPVLTSAAERQPLSISMEEYSYPHQVQLLPVTIEGQDLRKAYMDVQPVGKGNGRTVLLLQGKNFSGNYWKDSIQFLTLSCP